MRVRHIFFLLGVAFILTFLSAGCSGGGATPVEPNDGNVSNDNHIKDTAYDFDSSHRCVMAGYFCLNTETGEVTNIPDRTLMFHFDATPFVKLTFPNAYQTFPDDPTKRDWHIKVNLENPTEFEAYNARAIFYPEHSGPGGSENWSEVMEVVNYDGYAMLKGDDDFHPFINWIKHDFNYLDKFWPYWSCNKWMVFRVPIQWNLSKLIYLKYKIDVCFPGPIIESPYLFREFVLQSDETWYATHIEGYIDIPVFDWQADVKNLQLDLSPVSEDIGMVDCTYMYSEQKSNFGNGPEAIHFYRAEVYFHPDSDYAKTGHHKCDVWVRDAISNLVLLDHIYVDVEFDTEPPVSYSDGGEYKGLIDLLNADSKIIFYYDRAVDPSGVLYIFNYNQVQNAWDNPDQRFSVFECNEILMNSPHGYPACYLQKEWIPGEGNWFSVDAWDFPNNKAHTEYQKWGQPVRPSERWHKLAGIIGQQNTNWGSPILTDMDNDGDEDVLIANRMAVVFCFDGIYGNQPDGLIWSYDTEDSAIYSSLAAADVTGDGVPEIFVTTNGVQYGGVHCINGADGTALWTETTEDIIGASPCLTDLNGGGLDVVVGDNGGKLYAFDGLTGTPIWSQPWQVPGEPGIGSSCAAALFNDDDTPDVVFGAYDGYVYLVDGASGEMIWKFFCLNEAFCVESSPAVYHANGDGVPDVVVAAHNTIFCIDGKKVTGSDEAQSLWSHTMTAVTRNSPAIGDCNLDGVPDVVITSTQQGDSNLFIINGGNGDGIYAADIPGNCNVFASPILADVTADGHLNVIVGTNQEIADNSERYYVYNCDRLDYGVLLIDVPTTGAPLQAKTMPNSPTLGDVDNDGEWDMAYGSLQGRVFVHNFNTSIPTDPALRPWTTFHGNDRRDGNPFQEY